MIPPTVTVSVWSYCQQACAYCVAGSNAIKWTPKHSFEIWKPSGLEHADDFELRGLFGPEWWHEQCPDKERYLNPADVLPFDALTDWLIRFRPGATVHVSGGEPLLRPDIESGVEQLLDNGFDVVMVTNGVLIPKRPKLLDMPIKWAVTYHQDSVHLECFKRVIEPLKSRLHVIHTVVSRFEHARRLLDIEKAFSEFNFFAKWDRNPWRTNPTLKADPLDLVEPASYLLTLITPNGAVYPCNTCAHGPVGDIYSLRFDEQKARERDPMSRTCLENNRCAAYQSAVLMASL
jgi:MoaA/NifB/PqqE/SkfB family radical SAM enzyme